MAHSDAAAREPMSPLKYLPQILAHNERRCAAAALAMAYRALGLADRDLDDQQTIWPRIASADADGHLFARTYRLAADAVDHGLAATVLRARETAAAHRRTLGLLWRERVPTILNHRLEASQAAGHFSLVAGVSIEGIALHDPQWGPSRQLSWHELEALWSPGPSGGEVTGWVFVAIDRPLRTAATCTTCRTALPRAVVCEACGTPFPLVAAAVGCPVRTCPGCHWSALFCPRCDAPWQG